MMTDDGIVYEISFAIEETDRFDDWFPDATVEWATAPGVRRFRVYSGVGDDGHRQRLVFGFEDEADWHSFVETSAHQDCMETLEAVSTGVVTARWSPSAVTLCGAEPPITDSIDIGADGWFPRDRRSKRSADAAGEP